MAELCSYDEAYNIYDAEEIGWCAKCKCDKNCPMYKKLHIRILKERNKAVEFIKYLDKNYSSYMTEDEKFEEWR